MIKIAVFAFTDKGKELADLICTKAQGWNFRGEDLTAERFGGKADVERAFNECEGIIFVGAAGIAVRFIAPYCQDKLKDPAVIVIDEMGRFVIPILSGHVGGANGLTRIIAEELDAVPVLTTATDVEGMFAVDEFAAANDLKLSRREGIRTISGMLLKGKPVNMAIADDVIISDDASDIDKSILHLMVRPIVIGMGCRRDKDPAAVEEYFLKTVNDLGIDMKHICALASIDVKAEEKAFLELSAKYDIPFKTYTADELNAVEGDFEGSEFVKKTVGVDDVSGRAALKCGGSGKFILKKDSHDGMTISVFEKYRRVTFDYE